MRAYVAIILAIAMLGVGFIAVGGQIDQADQAINDSDPGADAYNASVDVTEKMTLVQGAVIPLAGMIAFALIGISLFAVVLRSGR